MVKFVPMGDATEMRVAGVDTLSCYRQLTNFCNDLIVHQKFNQHDVLMALGMMAYDARELLYGKAVMKLGRAIQKTARRSASRRSFLDMLLVPEGSEQQPPPSGLGGLQN